MGVKERFSAWRERRRGSSAIGNPSIAGENQRASAPGQHRRFFPKYDQSDRDRPVKGGETTPWKATVTREDILYILQRDEVMAKFMEKWAGAVCNKWYKIGADSDALKAKMEELQTRVGLQAHCKKGFLLAKTDGYCLMGLGWIETTAGPEEEPTGVSDIDYIQIIQKSLVSEIILGTDPMKKDYGEIISYRIKCVEGESETEKIIPAKRYIHWVNPFVDNRPEGISIFIPLYDALTSKKNLQFALQETALQQAKMMPSLTMPEDADQPEVDQAETYFKDWNVRSYFLLPNGYEMKLHATNAALNPQYYVEYFMTLLAAGTTGSKPALFGTEAGAVTGADVNTEEWYSFVSSEQQHFVEPIVRDFFKRCQAFGLLPAGNFWFEWEPLYEMDEKELSEIEYRRSQALFNTANAIVLLKNAGLDMTVEEGEITFSQAGQKLALPGLNSARPKALPARNQLVRGYLRPATRKKLLDKWQVKSQAIENEMSNSLRAFHVSFQNQFLALLRKLWEQEIGPIDIDPSKAAPATSAKVQGDIAAFFQGLDDWEASDYEAFRKDFVKWLKNGYSSAASQSLEAMGMSGPTFKLEDINVIRQIEAEGLRAAKDSYLEEQREALEEIAQGLKAGESYSRINDRIAEKFTQFSQGIPNSVQKFVHGVSVDARFDMMKKLGASDKIRYVTAGDERVRPEHEALDGQVMTEEEAAPYLHDWGCRCEPVPITIYDEAIAEQEKEEG